MTEYQEEQKPTEHFQTPGKLGDIKEPEAFHTITACRTAFPYSAKSEGLSSPSQLKIKLQNYPALSTVWGLYGIVSEAQERYRRSHLRVEDNVSEEEIKAMEVKGFDSCPQLHYNFYIIP